VSSGAAIFSGGSFSFCTLPQTSFHYCAWKLLQVTTLHSPSINLVLKQDRRSVR
jgi:hypothetical protein